MHDVARPHGSSLTWSVKRVNSSGFILTSKVLVPSCAVKSHSAPVMQYLQSDVHLKNSVFMRMVSFIFNLTILHPNRSGRSVREGTMASQLIRRLLTAFFPAANRRRQACDAQSRRRGGSAFRVANRCGRRMPQMVDETLQTEPRNRDRDVAYVQPGKSS